MLNLFAVALEASAPRARTHPVGQMTLRSPHTLHGSEASRGHPDRGRLKSPESKQSLAR